MREPTERAGRVITSIDQLTSRERDVLELVSQGLTDRGISESLWVAPKTVETHIRHILSKLDLPSGARHNRRVLAVLAYLERSQDPPV